jgi:hypothetical protein
MVLRITLRSSVVDYNYLRITAGPAGAAPPARRMGSKRFRMRISPVSSENIAEFVQYCRRYGVEHDESFLPDDTFIPTQAPQA